MNTKIFRAFILAVFLSGFCRVGIADVITMASGRNVECLILQQDDKHVLIRLAYGTMDVPRGEITKIEIKPLPGISTKPARDRAATRPAIASRLPSWANAIDALAKENWAQGLIQIPATVIDNGVLRFVPYMSQRCGTDYEMNVYGDPDAPAGVEIGVRCDLLKSSQAKQNCLDYIASILPNPSDAKLVRGDRS